MVHGVAVVREILCASYSAAENRMPSPFETEQARAAQAPKTEADRPGGTKTP